MDAVERRTTSYKQRVPSSTTLLFVIAVNPEDVQYNQESLLHCHHKARGPPKRHKSHLLASHDERATTIESAAYPVPSSSLSTWRMCSTTGRVYCSATTKLEDHQNVTSPVCLHPMICRRRRGNRQLIHSVCQSEHPRLLRSSVYYPLHHIL